MMDIAVRSRVYVQSEMEGMGNEGSKDDNIFGRGFR